jgi:hypothetical protein
MGEIQKNEPNIGGVNNEKVEETPKVEAQDTIKNEPESEHAEAVALVERHRDFFEHYAKGQIKIEPAPAGLKTFAFDLENNTIYINAMFYKKFGFSEQKTIFATLHEIEHFQEKLQILAEEGGERVFERYVKRIKESKAFSLMDNCVADIRENRAVVSRSEGMSELERQIYKEHLFPEKDFTSSPKHIQFSQAILREARVPDEKCVVDPEVRAALDEIYSNKGLMDVMTDPSTPMSTRLRLQDKYIWPKVKDLLEKDIEDRKKKNQEGKDGSGEKQGTNEEGDRQDGDDETRGEVKPNEDKNDGKEENTKPGKKGDEGDKKPVNKPGGVGDESKSGDNKGDEKEGKEGEKGNEEGKPEETDPNIIFADDYAKIEKKFPEAVPIEDIEKALKKWKEAKMGEKKGDKADEDYARKIGVEKKDLQEYRTIVKSLEKIVNPETNVNILEELRSLFTRIISKRLKKAQAPRYPVEEGDELVDPAQLVADVKSGNLQSMSWEDTEIKEKRGDRFGEVEITLVCDRSSSMDEGNKAIEQRRSAVLIMEVLKEFAELCEAEKINVDHPLEIKSEIYGFGANEDTRPMKRMSSELGEAERVNILKKLHSLPGSTTDFVSLQAIYSGLNEETKKKMKEGELKKIVIVFTDGESNNPAMVQVELQKLKENGVVVIGIGITKARASVLTTYAPNALVVEDVSKLPLTIGELLKEHLNSL